MYLATQALGHFSTQRVLGHSDTQARGHSIYESFLHVYKSVIFANWMKTGKNITPGLHSFCNILQPSFRLLRALRLLGTEENFHCYVYQMPKPLSHSSYFLRIEKD